jgi:hypothetical protein
MGLNMVERHKGVSESRGNVFFNHMVGIKTTGEQISILCHNGTIFDKQLEKTV